MVAKGLLTAAFLLSCTAAWGEGPGGQCSKGECAKGECSTSKCSVAKSTASASTDDCCAGEACPLAKCASEAYASLKCAVGACSTTCSDEKCGDAKYNVAESCNGGKCRGESCGDKECSAESCSDGTCATAKCATSKCAVEYALGQYQPERTALEAKLAELAQVQREVAVLRASSGQPEQLKVTVKVVEINHSECRKLGFDFKATSTPICEFDSQTIRALEENNLMRVVVNPTLVLTAGRAGRFVSGIETPLLTGSDQRIEREFIGTKVDVLAIPVGNSKVRVEIRPEFSELDRSNSDCAVSSVKVRCWDTGFETTLGKTVVMNGLVQPRVRAARVEEHGKSRVIEEVVEIESLLLVTVESADPVAPMTISQTTYEESLVSLVQEPACVTKVYPVPDLQVWKVRPGGVEFDAELLVNHLQASVAPKSWRCEANPDADATIEVFERNGSLVICQTKENHRAIADMLSELRGRDEAEEKVSVGAPCSASKANGKCAESQETLQCSAVDGDVAEVKLAWGKRFVQLPCAEVEECPIGECSTGFSVEPRCANGSCTR